MPPVLQDVSFSLQPGQHLAIVGASGAGKTTLVNLLLRFWEPTQGQIKLGEVDIGKLDPDQLRGALGVVSQHTYLFNGTLRENLLLAYPAASTQALDQACQAAQLSVWIESLPDGLETWIGENGLQLSAGERQRVALARVLLKPARLLILDEPAANLDSRTEKAVQQAVESLLHRCGVLTITHRLSGLGRVDEILVLDQGQVVERGSFEALLKQRGLFWQMWKLEQEVF
jgi:ATP-binding cassette subfamily C protein CydC